MAAVVWLALRIFKRGFNAATRYAIWWITLLAMVVLPIFLLVAANRRATAPPRATEQTTQIAPASPATPVSQSAFGPEQPARRKFSWLPSLPIRLPFSPWIQRFGEFWALISLLLLARLAAGFTSLHFQKKYAREALPELRELLDHSLARLAIKRRVRLALISEGNSPMLAGVIRPHVLIPERLLSELEHAEMEQIFLHEATHAARYDDWALLLQRVIQSVFIFYPVVYWVARQINLEREAACDADVISVTGDPRAYAKCLTHVAELSLGEWKSPLAAAIADEKSYLTRRILMLFGNSRHTGTRLLTIRLALAAAVVFFLAALAVTSPAFFASARQGNAQSGAATGSSERPKFEVASVKPCGPISLGNVAPQPSGGGRGVGGGGVNPVQWSPGRLTVTCMWVRPLITWAYAINADGQSRPDRIFGDFFSAYNVSIEGLPSWASGRTNSERFTIIGEAPEDVTKEMMMGPMMQSLLEDRFHLKIHTETRDVPGYELHVAKGGPKLPESEDAVCRAFDPKHPGGRLGPESLPNCNMQLIGVTMADFAAGMKGPPVGQPVVDKTGLKGTFAIHMLFTLESGDDSGLPTYFEALKEQLGLELVPAKETDRVLVVDHVEEPTAN